MILEADKNREIVRREWEEEQVWEYFSKISPDQMFYGRRVSDIQMELAEHRRQKCSS